MVNYFCFVRHFCSNYDFSVNFLCISVSNQVYIIVLPKERMNFMLAQREKAFGIGRTTPRKKLSPMCIASQLTPSMMSIP